MGVARRVLCQDTDPRARSNNQGTREPHAIHLYGLSRTSVTSTSPDDPTTILRAKAPNKTRSRPDRNRNPAAYSHPQGQRSKIANVYTSCTWGVGPSLLGRDVLRLLVMVGG